MDPRAAAKQRKQESETELRQYLIRSRSGDSEAYRSFLAKTAPLLRAYLKNAVRYDEQDHAEDLVQDTLMAIHSKKHLYDENQPVLPWIYAIARYRLIDAYRMKGSRPAFADVENFDEIFAGEGTPESALSAHQEGGMEAAHELLSGLSEQQRQVLIMAKVDEMPLAEIAKKTNLSLSAVKVTIHRAIKNLRSKTERSDEKT